MIALEIVDMDLARGHPCLAAVSEPSSTLSVSVEAPAGQEDPVESRRRGRVFLVMGIQAGVPYLVRILRGSTPYVVLPTIFSHEARPSEVPPRE